MLTRVTARVLKLDKQTWRRKRNVHRKICVHVYIKSFSLKFCDIWHNFYFYRILNDEDFKMEGKEKKTKENFVTHLIITEQLYY